MSLAFTLALATALSGDGGPSVPRDQPLKIPPPASRFELRDPVGGLPGVMLDWANDSIGLAQQATRGAQKYQARIIWIDATANIDRYNTEQKIVDLVATLKDVGFNTIVFDVKPISGQVVYPSAIAPKLTEWRGRELPVDFDPLAIMAREAKKDHISLCVSVNAFSEGHQLMKTGPAYAGTMAQWQTVLYDTKVQAVSAANTRFNVSSAFNKLDPDPNLLSVFDDATKLSPLTDGYFWVAIDRNGVVTQSESGTQIGKAKLPANGSIMIGQGAGADFLRGAGGVGMRLDYDTLPLFVPIAERPNDQIPLMVNPILPAVQDYERSIAREIVTKYQVDGIIYDDRLRFAGMNSDFSPYTQSQFEKYLGRRVSWPEDVFQFTLTPGLDRGLLPGKYYEAWMTWRAQELRNYVLSVRNLVKSIRPSCLFGVYTGSWYGEYPRLGQNWASPEAEAGFWFLTPSYAETGLAPQVDFLITGCYYPTATIRDAMARAVPIGFTVESAGQLSNRLVRDETWTYAGIALDQYRGNPDGLADALQAACGSTQGVMVFDLSHDIESALPVFRSAFRESVLPPHEAPGLLDEVRKRRAAVDKLGRRDPPIIISGGQSGTGQ